MSINYIVNDPGVAGAQPEAVSPSADRSASKVGFSIKDLPVEQVYATDTNEFVAWQAREAALRTIETFEAIAGGLVGWTGKASKKRLGLLANAGEDLNAYYDRASVSFFEFPLGTRKLYSGASTDVVAHEVGHAILDALRPDLWSAQMFEVPAFHEGFGDCIAIMAALADQATRVALLQANPTLGLANFVESTAEELSFGVGKTYGPNHNAAKPRRASNSFQWSLPQSLPDDGKPGVLINEIHSFGQLTSGCYYELIREIFLAGQGGEQGLWDACRTATKLLALAAADAPIRARFLEAVGRTMILADRSQNNGANETFIRTAFQRHGIELSVATFLAPRVALASPRRRTTKKKKKATQPKTAAALLTPTTRQFLHALLEVDPKAKLSTQFFGPTGREAAHVVARRGVDLTGLSERLSNVKTYTPYSTLIGSDGGSPAVLGAVDPGAITSREVREYVRTLVERGQIDFAPETGKATAKSKPGREKQGGGFISLKNHPTHVVKQEGGELVLERIGFACGCSPRCRSSISV